MSRRQFGFETRRFVAGSVFCALLCSGLHAGGVFWSDRGTGTIHHMTFQGRQSVALSLSGEVKTAGSNVRGVAVDNEGSWVYWADNGADRLLRARFDGSESEVLHAVPGGRSFPADVVFSRIGQQLFWCDRNRGHIRGLRVAEREVYTLIEDAAPTGPYFMDYQPEAGFVYWGAYGGGSIHRARLDGTDRQVLVTGNRDVRGVKLDPGEGMLYWVDRNDSKVYRARLASLLDAPVPVTDDRVELLYSGLDTPHGLVLDIPARKLYWADTGTNTGAGRGEKSINRGDFDGATPQEVLVQGSQPWDVALDRRCASYLEWQERVFRRDESPMRTRPDADPDGDGLVNALEYAFDRAPLYAESKSPFSGSIVVQSASGVVQHVLEYPRRERTTDLEFKVSGSTKSDRSVLERVSGELEERSVLSQGDDMAVVTVATTYSVGELAEHYLRLTVTLAGNAHTLVVPKSP